MKAFLKAGEEAVADKDYYNATYYYKTALEFDTTNLEVRYKYGETAKIFNAFSLAEEAFSYVVSNDSDNTYPLASLYLAQTQQSLGKYDDAERNYQLFLSEYSGDEERHKLKAEMELEAIAWARDKVDNPAQGITTERLGNDVNTPYSEFSAIKFEDKLYYSSLRFELKEKNRRVQRLFSKILASGEESETDTLEADLGVGQHHANITFNTDATRVYYTVCNYTNGSDLKCDLYQRSIDEEGNWGNAVILPAIVNDSIATSTQPTVGYDINIDKEILYFSSNREGGKGGMDIWYSVINGEDYSAPQNLTSINTSSDEITPFFHTPTNTLYFSSDGRMGMGGFDIYSSYKDENVYELPVNIEAPINSSFNDIYYVLNSEGTEAHYSSNRIGSLFLEDSFEACCFDIYRAEIEELFIDLNTLTFNELTRDPLKGARVTIIDPINGDILFESIQPLTNEHKFRLKCGREYIIMAEKDGYQPAETSINTRDCNQEEEIIKKLYLVPNQVKLEVFTFDELTQEMLPGTTVSLTNLMDENEPPIVLTNPNTNKFTFDIIAGGKYQITASKKGYETIIKMVDSDNIIEGVVTEKVFLIRRGFDLNEYLPVTVYFDNDAPNPRSRKLYTNDSYTETYFPFMSKKDEFKENYASSLSGDLRSTAEADVEYFFEIDVKGGFDHLQLFIEKLKERLDAGDIIELSLKGYASPKAANKYNLATRATKDLGIEE